MVHDSEVSEKFYNVITDLVSAMNTHSTAMVALTIALSMNSDNCIAAIKDETPPYDGDQYIKMLQAFKLIDIVKTERRN